MVRAMGYLLLATFLFLLAVLVVTCLLAAIGGMALILEDIVQDLKDRLF